MIGRVLTMFFILGGIMFFTTVTHDSVEMVRYLRSGAYGALLHRAQLLWADTVSAAGHGRYKRLSGVPHTVIVGDMSADTLGYMFQEFFTESRRNSPPRAFNRHCEIVLLSTRPMDDQVSLLTLVLRSSPAAGPRVLTSRRPTADGAAAELLGSGRPSEDSLP